MIENARPTVLRSINLPTSMEEQLRGIAFLLRRPKSDVIRWCIDQGLVRLIDRMKQASPLEMERVADELQLHVSEEEQRARQNDIQRIIIAGQESGAIRA